MKSILLKLIFLIFLINYGCGQNKQEAFLIDQALEAFNNEDYSRAIIYFDSILMTEPTSAIAYQMKGRAQVNSGQYKDGILSLKKAINLNPNDPEHYHFLGITYSNYDDPQKATEFLETAAQLDKENDQIQISLGGNHFRLGQYEDAKKAYKKALEMNPNDTEILYFYASVIRILGEEENIELLNSVIEETDDDYLKLIIFIELEEFKRFKKLAIQIHRENPKDAYLSLLEGDNYLKQKQYTLAIEKYQMADSLGIASSSLQNNIAYCLIKSQEYEKALSYLDAIILASPDYYNALGNRGNALMQVGRFDDAMNDFNRGINNKPMHPGIYKLRGELFLKMDQKAKACEDFQFALTRHYQNLYQNDEINELIKANCE